MSKILIHIHSGPESKNQVTLGFLVAYTAVKEGHELKMFLAADAVHLLNCLSKGEIVGEGTGDLKGHLDFIKNADLNYMFLECLQKREVMMIVY